MTVEEFNLIVEKICPYTNYIYLHVLGEPLLHPHLDEILGIAENNGLNINITTNGSLIEQKKQIMLSHSIRQINISLHDAEENIEAAKWENHLQKVLDFACEISPKTYVSFRLWNTSNEGSEDFNRLCLNLLARRFNHSDEFFLQTNTKGNGIKLAEHIFLQRAPRFDWPDETQTGVQITKTCYALRDHIAILSDGHVVPCCLDADASLKLGDIYTENLADILETTRAKDIKKGFEQHKVVESFCSTCGFSKLL